jgi:hypothetical protein
MLMSLEGLSPAEIAQTLGIKRNAADAILHRARRHLAMRLKDCRDAVWGASGFVWLRIRLGARRAADWLRLADPSGAIAPAVAGLSALVVLAIHPGAERVQDGVGSRRAPITFVKADGVVAASAFRGPLAARRGDDGLMSAAEDGRERPPDGVRVDFKKKRVSVITTAKDPTTGETGPFGIAVWHERSEDPNKERYSGPLIDRAFELICTDELHLCDGG